MSRLPSGRLLALATAVSALTLSGCDFDRMLNPPPEDSESPRFEGPPSNPAVEIVSPAGGDTITDSSLQVRLVASDSVAGVASIRVVLRGALESEDTLTFSPAASAVDTTATISLSGAMEGDLRIRAVVESGNGGDGEADPVSVFIADEVGDVDAGAVQFNLRHDSRLERNDPVRVTVSGSGETGIQSVGLTVVASGEWGSHTLSFEEPADEHTFQFTPADLAGLPVALDSKDGPTTLQITAFAHNGDGRCVAAVAPDSRQALDCLQGSDGATRAEDRAGHSVDVTVVRGGTVSHWNTDMGILDMVVDRERRRLFLSNHDRHTVDVLRTDDLSRERSIRVGSQPWGLAVNADTTELFVANSGGTNISRLSIDAPDGGLALSDSPANRIFTPNVALFQVTYDDEDLGFDVRDATVHNYSDRPQYIAATASGRLLYSTKPTGTAPDGTLRSLSEMDDDEDVVEYFLDYVEGSGEQEIIVENARSVRVIPREGEDELNHLRVCRRDGSCVEDRLSSVVSQLDTTEVRFRFGMSIADVGLSDTTFVAVSGDHRTVMFGEGVNDPARVMAFREDESGAGSMYTRVEETTDLLNNASDRVSGLALNYDGSLAAARGESAYMFTDDLRLQGSVRTGSPAGGIALEPGGTGYPAQGLRDVAFVPGVEADVSGDNGAAGDAAEAFIDIVGTFNFERRARLPIKSPVTGPVAVMNVSPGGTGSEFRLFAVTAMGVIALDLTDEDYAPR